MDDLVRILNEQSRAIGRIESSLEKLVGNGQPGLVKEMRDDIDSLIDSRAHAKGYAAGFAAALAILEFIYHYFEKRLGLK